MYKVKCIPFSMFHFALIVPFLSTVDKTSKGLFGI